MSPWFDLIECMLCRYSCGTQKEKLPRTRFAIQI